MPMETPKPPTKTTMTVKHYCNQCHWFKDETGTIKKRIDFCVFIYCYKKPYTLSCRYFRAK